MAKKIGGILISLLFPNTLLIKEFTGIIVAVSGIGWALFFLLFIVFPLMIYDNFEVINSIYNFAEDIF